MTTSEKLHQFRDKKTKPDKDEVWVPPTRELLPASAKLLAADQSLGATGVVAMIVYNGWPIVTHAAKIAGVSHEVGHEGNLGKAEDLEDEFDMLLDAWRIDSAWRFVHEAVPPSKGQTMRPESSLLAASALRRIARRRGVTRLPSIDPRVHAKFMTGTANATKKDRRRMFSTVVQSMGLEADEVRNEATRDAASVALCALVTHAEVVWGG